MAGGEGRDVRSRCGAAAPSIKRVRRGRLRPGAGAAAHARRRRRPPRGRGARSCGRAPRSTCGAAAPSTERAGRGRLRPAAAANARRRRGQHAAPPLRTARGWGEEGCGRAPLPAHGVIPSSERAGRGRLRPDATTNVRRRPVQRECGAREATAGGRGLSRPARRRGKGGCGRAPLLARGAVPSRECDAGGVAGRRGQRAAPPRSVRQRGKEAAALDRGQGGATQSNETTGRGELRLGAAARARPCPIQ